MHSAVPASGYAVIDTETTGILPGWHHRIAEIAIVHVGWDGVITDEWSTVVNPDRDLGPQHIHGIRAADARRAPRFPDIASELVSRLRGRIPVAHNWPFDAMHLRAEFERMNVDTPLGSQSGLCTMRAAAGARLSSGRSLVDCCAAAGLPSHDWHTAREDAIAAAELLGFLIQHAPEVIRPDEQQQRTAAWDWADISGREVALVHRTPTERVQPHFLARLVERVPRDGEPDVDAYLAMLDGVLLDREVSETEADALVELANEIGLHSGDALAVHARYLRDLARAAWEDQVVTPEERGDIRAVAALLGLAPPLADQVIEQERTATRTPAPSTRPKVTAGGLTLRPGDTVVLTGSMVRKREDIVSQAGLAGIRVTTSVSKQTAVLVAADPDSLSGKAKKARDLAVPVVSEGVFLRLLDGLGAR